jgi:4-hydroxy-tetrahydrodipicolinate reductase
MRHIEQYAEKSSRVVIGTTGWYAHIDQVKDLYKNNQGALLWSSNFAIGVHIYFRLLAVAARQFNEFPEYDVFGREIHHKYKKDSPSGTTLSAAKELMTHLDRKNTLVTDELHRKIEDHELHFSSTRGGFANFSHEVFFDSADETITITHSARNRNIYADGAIRAAEWLL